MARMLILTLFGATAVLLGLANGILMLILAVSPISTHHGIYIFPMAAAVLQICSSCALVALNFLQIRHQEILQKRRGYLLIAVLGVLPSVVSTAVVGASLGWGESSIVNNGVLVLGSQVSVFLTMTFVVWAITVLAYLVYYFSLAWVLKSATKTSPERFSIDEAPQEMVESSRPPTATTVQSNPFRQVASLPPSVIASEGTSSLRSSFSTIQRPSSSKRGLLIRQPSNKYQSRSSSSDGPSRRPSQDEGFDSWDTSGVSSQIRETVLQTKPMMKGSGLEPIPGSRSPSPAKALEGPFFQSSPSITPPESPLPQPSVSQPNSPPASPLDHPLELPNFSAMFPPSSPSATSPTLQRNFSRSGSRSGPASRSGANSISRSRPHSRSRAPSEDHIHPLFRTSSPTPPPSASANTNVTAAPEAGQLINERMLYRMRSGSLPSIPSPLVRSESSPDICTVMVPPSPSLDTMPVPYTKGSRPDRPHQRKRSASFQESING